MTQAQEDLGLRQTQAAGSPGCQRRAAAPPAAVVVTLSAPKFMFAGETGWPRLCQAPTIGTTSSGQGQDRRGGNSCGGLASEVSGSSQRRGASAGRTAPSGGVCVGRCDWGRARRRSAEGGRKDQGRETEGRGRWLPSPMKFKGHHLRDATLGETILQMSFGHFLRERLSCL